MNHRNFPIPATLTVLTLLAVVAGCNRSEAPAAAPPEVSVVTASSRDAPLQHDLVGRVAATRVAEVRARVAGIVLERVYKEGSEVEQGQLLFRIDPAPMQAALNEKLAALQQARATAKNARTQATRVEKLAARGVIAQQALDDANAKAASDTAAVAQAEAAVATARLNLSYTEVKAPIAGRAGRALVTEGALVGQGTATELTRIEQIDPLYVNFSQPMEVVEQLRKEQAQGGLELDTRSQMQVTLTLADGSAYGYTGTLDFSDMRVDPETGSMSLRALVPNPDNNLLPGMFVKLRLDAGTLKHVFLVPQAAVQRDGNSAYVLVVGDDGKVQRKNVNARSIQGSNWIIDAGIENGDQVVTSGIQQVRPGQEVHVKPGQSMDSGAASAPPDAH